MVTRTFITKSNTIFKGSKDNFGLNPIGMLNYGKIVSRCLLYFNTDNMKIGGKHFLKLTNCGSIDQRTFDDMVFSTNDGEPKERACSFDIIAFKIPEYWDEGRGYDNSNDFWLVGKNSSSTHGSNWYQAYDGKLWGAKLNESGYTISEEGVYDNDFLEEEYKKFSRGEDSVIINRQHFDAGNEDINIDITSYVDEVLSGISENFGIGLAYTPMTEKMEPIYTQYYGFFTSQTNTFFHPVVESRYSAATISDNRYSFYIGKTNKLYFYADFGGVLTDLDILPTCTIKGVEYPVKRANTGIYYIEVKLSKEEAKNNEIIYDIWSNLVYEGEELEEVELEFVAHKKEDFFKLGEFTNKISSIVPSLSGINDNEKIYQGDERTVNVIFKIPYSQDYELLNDCYYRLYVKDGKREIDIIDWDNIDTIGANNTFKIKSTELVPNQYYIDIKAKLGNDIRIFKNKLNFIIVDNITELKK